MYTYTVVAYRDSIDFEMWTKNTQSLSLYAYEAGVCARARVYVCVCVCVCMCAYVVDPARTWSSLFDRLQRSCTNIGARVSLSLSTSGRRMIQSATRCLWGILRKVGVPERLIAIIRSFHASMTATLLIPGGETELIAVRNGLRQGCCMAPVPV